MLNRHPVIYHFRLWGAFASIMALGLSSSCLPPQTNLNTEALKTVPGCDSNGKADEHNPHCVAAPLVLPVNDSRLDPTFSQMGTFVSDGMPFGARTAFVNFSNDGYSDLAVYSRHFVNGIASGINSDVIVYSGKDHSVLHTFTGSYHFGQSISSAGNFAHDGFDALIVGASNSSHDGVPAAVYIYSGRDYSLIYSMVGTDNSLLGWVVSGAGDVDGDGYDDVLVTDPSFSSNRGKIYVISGRDHSVLFSATGENAGDYFGQSAASIGDINGDGLPDVVVGTRDFGSQLPNTQLTGKVYVYSPATGQLLWSKNGSAFEGLGIGVTSAGDFNHDSIPDLIVQSGISNTAYVLSGRDGSVLFQQSSQPYYFGLNTAAVGDVNNDGYDDVAIGNWSSGNIQIISGKTASAILTITPNPQDVLGKLGAFLVSGKNFNGDGKGNLAVTAIDARVSVNDGNPRGKVYVISSAGAAH